MTMINDIDQTCSVCGKPSLQPVLLSTNSSGYPDLDLRPPEMQRSTMITWIHECPHCGYVSSDLSDELDISKDFLNSEEYLTCDGFKFESDLAGLFYKGYLIAEQANDMESCFFNLIHCAWKCDDYEDDSAISIRKLAISYVDKLIEYGENRDYLLIKADLLRRSGEFNSVIEEYSSITIGDELLDKIVQFQIEKAKMEDNACYTVKDVIEE